MRAFWRARGHVTWSNAGTQSRLNNPGFIRIRTPSRAALAARSQAMKHPLPAVAWGRTTCCRTVVRPALDLHTSQTGRGDPS